VDYNEYKYELDFEQRDLVELMAFLPARKIVFGVLMILVPVLIIFNFMIPPISTVILNGDNKIEKVTIIGLGVFSILFLELMAYVLYKVQPKASGKLLFRKMKNRGVEKMKIIYDNDTNRFIVGPRQTEVIPDSKLKIVSTDRNFLFYCGMGIFSKKFYIPKNSINDSAKKVVNILSEKNSVKIVNL
jgi:hypothetical protein